MCKAHLVVHLHHPRLEQLVDLAVRVPQLLLALGSHLGLFQGPVDVGYVVQEQPQLLLAED